MLLFLVNLINIEKFRISFSLFYSFSFIIRSRATSIGIGMERIHGLRYGDTFVRNEILRCFRLYLLSFVNICYFGIHFS